ncbi:hydantoin racemase-like protein [Lophium mytilinum]|uniref:Hydantoin racemase-like protein n=1 Tax=Lophium mytilinum TaxID=390894 RepID=A0A6A6QC88_9PEZI|nr:hydantoin racemase-like protein [Lophium mytilinum]
MTNKTHERRSILIINPNSTESMTRGLEPLVDSLNFKETNHTFFTSPTGPTSINDETDAADSARHALPHLLPLLPQHSGFLVACYSKHPLVPLLKSKSPATPVTGIFEASVATALQLIAPDERFGIVSTGKVWEGILSEAVADLLGAGGSARFAGVETTGLTATGLHDAPAEEVRRRMKDAVKRLLRKDGARVGAVCLGCAGMAGMGEMVREACVEELGEEGRRVRVVDGVQAGVAWLEGAVRSDF